MTGASGQLAVLDTNVVVHLARNDPTGQKIESHYSLMSRPDRPLLSTVVEGEILGLAREWGWGDNKMRLLRDLLKELVRVSAGAREVVDAYAELYFEATRTGSPRGENDLWIAATAKATGAALFTCDADFGWLDPHHLCVYYIPEAE